MTHSLCIFITVGMFLRKLSIDSSTQLFTFHTVEVSLAAPCILLRSTLSFSAEVLPSVPVRVSELLLAAAVADGSFLGGMLSSRLCRLRKLPVRLLRRLSFLGLSLAGRPPRLTWAGESAAVSPLV